MWKYGRCRLKTGRARRQPPVRSAAPPPHPSPRRDPRGAHPSPALSPSAAASRTAMRAPLIRARRVLRLTVSVSAHSPSSARRS
ncbi:hypothetical protein EVAR_21936_1 [Eumeta japonica]|uniref:Uncharacterized protein n=1 Tax=Eumeta variegata TaxID=151549 RepID=A0A4C1XJ85_EUMVA|nr:hypothetical protein EVAR_21936_1 [Eumeta japonica]